MKRKIPNGKKNMKNRSLTNIMFFIQSSPYMLLRKEILKGSNNVLSLVKKGKKKQKMFLVLL